MVEAKQAGLKLEDLTAALSYHWTRLSPARNQPSLVNQPNCSWTILPPTTVNSERVLFRSSSETGNKAISIEHREVPVVADLDGAEIVLLDEPLLAAVASHSTSWRVRV